MRNFFKVSGHLADQISTEMAAIAVMQYAYIGARRKYKLHEKDGGVVIFCEHHQSFDYQLKEVAFESKPRIKSEQSFTNLASGEMATYKRRGSSSWSGGQWRRLAESVTIGSASSG